MQITHTLTQFIRTLLGALSRRRRAHIAGAKTKAKHNSESGGPAQPGRSPELSPRLLARNGVFQRGRVVLSLLVLLVILTTSAVFLTSTARAFGWSQAYTKVASVLSNGKQYLSAWMGGANGSELTPAACTLTQEVTVSSCYYTTGSRATVSVEVAWTGAINGDTITVSLDGGAQTRTIKPESLYDPGTGSAVAGPISSPQVVAFEITADGAAHTISSSLSGAMSCGAGTTNFNAPAGCVPNLCTSGELGGTVYFDYDADGVKDSGETNGAAGVTVMAFDVNGTTYSATSDSAGRYEFSAANGNAIPAGSYPVRLEFTNLPASGFQTTTPHGANNSTSVQFAASSACNFDLGVMEQIGFCQDNPYVVTPCYVNGDPAPTSGSNLAGDGDALVAFPYNSSGGPTPATMLHLATARQVGSVWGVAYNKFTKKVFTSAMLRRHVGLGPQGLGGMYVTDMTVPASATTSNFIDVVADLGIDVGQASVPSVATRGLSSNKTNPSYDTAVFGLVGKVGIGDIDISDDGNTLWFVNLFDKKLYGLDLTAYNTSNTLPTSAEILFSTTIPGPTCTNGTIRPWGAKFKGGKLYAGSVCDASSGGSSDLRARVSYFDPSTNLWTTAFEFPLTYPKGFPIFSLPQATGWYRWTDSFAEVTTFNGLFDAGFGTGTMVERPQPILSDIEFDLDGTMILTLMDRQGLQLGYMNYGPNSPDTTLYMTSVGGDVLRAFSSNGAYILENNAQAGPETGAGPNNNQGPGFGEFYNDNWIVNGFLAHTEHSMGALALKPGSGETINVVIDPVNNTPNSGGVRWLSNTSGQPNRSYNVYTGSANGGVGGNGLFGKAVGLGDVELTCEPVSYLEIGNRLWMDTDRDGVQDPGEMPIAGVTLRLYTPAGRDGIAGNADDLTPIATAVTDANGTFYFTSQDANEDGIPDSDANTANNTGLVGGGAANPTYPAIQPNTRYVIRADRPQDYQSGGALYGKLLTAADFGSGTLGSPADLRDSDAALANVLGIAGGNFPEVEVKHLVNGAPTNGTGAFGEDDHTLDMGFQAFYDFGDAPDPTFPTLLANNGARHVIVAGVHLGAGVDDDADGQPGVNHDGDDNDVDGDDEDGVVLPTLIAGQTATIQVTASVAGILNGWIDWNNDGSWGAGEQIFNDLAVVAGINNLNINVPLGAVQATVCTRFRFVAAADGNAAVNSPTGQAPSGEVEDYPATVLKNISLGNQVFYDTNNNGLRDGGEAGINGVVVELYADSDMNGTPDTAFPLDRKTTATVGLTDGLFLFTQQTLNTTTGVALGAPIGLIPGKYVVCLPASNFTGTGALVGLWSSGTTAGLTGATTETTAPDPNTGGAVSNPGIDNDDNGTRDGSGKVLSRTIDVGINEPLTENPYNNNDATVPDSLSNLTVDFGFYGLSVGNLVFNDGGAGGNYNNAAFDSGETGIGGVTVRLYAENGTTLLMTKTTDNNGKYLFPGLAVGKYYVEVVRDAVLNGFVSSRDGVNVNNTNAADSDDNGPQANVTPSAVRSPQIMLVAGDSTATGESDQAQSASPGFGNPAMTDNAATPDANSNLEVDFGFVRVYSLGNRVWKDLDNSGTLNGSEVGIDNVTLRLLVSPALTQATDLYGATIADQTTASGGYFRFDNVPRGDYVIEVRATNFSGVLNGCISSTADAGDPDTDTDDSDDNGVGSTPNVSNGIRSVAVTLGEGSGTAEPINDNDPATNPQTNEAPDNQSNRTVDFGFTPIYSLGNRVWKDLNNSGTIDAADGGTPGVDGVIVRLLNANTLAQATDYTGALVADQTTSGGGYYRFDNLLAGDYVAEVRAANFTGVGVLVGCMSSSADAGDPDTDVDDSDDNGVGIAPNVTTGIRSAAITLGPAVGSEPTNDNDPATNPLPGEARNDQSNRTLDFAFVPVYSLGNRVWEDRNNNGAFDGGENSIDGVFVRLLDGTGAPASDIFGTPVPDQTTSGGGYYRFDNLLTGDYIVEIISANFTSGVLQGTVSSVPDAGDPDVDQDDNDDNGVGVFPGANGVRSLAVTLGPGLGTEPTTDNDPTTNPLPGEAPNGQSNRTVDFGFVRVYSLGNRVWRDLNNSGTIDAADGATPGIAGVQVRLLDSAGVLSARDIEGKVISPVVTDTDGCYRFDLLPAGDYIVEIGAVSFQTGGPLVNHTSSTGAFATTGPNEPGPDPDTNPNDNDDNGTMQYANNTPLSARSSVITLGEGNGQQEPTPDADECVGDPGAFTTDNQSNLTVDFGFVPLLSLGNVVWKDVNNNGIFEPPAETGVALVTLNLYRDNGATPGAFDAGDTLVTSTVSSGGSVGTEGRYLFTGLLPGDYLVQVAPLNFQAGGALLGCLSSTTTTPDPDTPLPIGGTDDDDNGIDNPTPATGGIVSGVISLFPFGEPDTPIDTDGTLGNLTLDFGFYSTLNLGNLVWKDNDNDGTRDAGEPGIDGVAVELFLDRNNNSIPPTEFQGPNGRLLNCFSSTPSETTPNNDVDNNDNGLQQGTPATDGVYSGLVTMQPNTEPDTNVDTDGRSGNLTVDFGFYGQVSLGNLVWKDMNNNGLRDNGEPGVGDVTVLAYRDDGNNTFDLPADQLAGTATTSTAPATLGQYLFPNLAPGNYFVVIPAAEFQAGGDLFGCLSSTQTATDPNAPPAVGGVDNDDNGLDNPAPASNGIVSGLVSLTQNGEPPTNLDGDDANGNLTVDFGFYSPVTLGNLVWKDVNNNGVRDLAPTPEAGIGNVTVQLYRDNGDGQFVLGPDVFVTSTTTSTAPATLGQYQFPGLLPGNYFVVIPAAEFQTGGDLAGCLSSTPTELNPNADGDNNDNGLNSTTPATTGITSGLVTLLSQTEPPVVTDGDDINGNQTVDFGFYATLTLGNLIWKDYDNDGVRDLTPTPEPVVPNVTIELFADRNNNNTFEPNGADAPRVAVTVTDANGLYQFSNLLPGDYFVLVSASNFQTGQPLAGCLSSTGADTTDQVDNNDNGLDSATAANNGIVSTRVTLTGLGEPAAGVDGDDTNGNQTIDFGFYPPLSLGNLLWKDLDNDGVFDNNEPLVNGVTVELFLDRNNSNSLEPTGADAPVLQTTVSANGGKYQFNGLAPGTYFVRIAASNFAPGGVLEGCLSSTGNDPGDSTDNNDNGIDNPTPTNGGVVTPPIPVSGNTEPPTNVDGDGPNGNQTIDFGFIPQMSLGNLVWKDNNNNGVVDAGEPGIGNVTVELYRETNSTAGLQLGGGGDTLAGSVTTSAVPATLGQYNFTNLVPGTYYVRIPAAEFAVGGDLAGCFSSTVTTTNPNLPPNVGGVDNDDNGLDAATPATTGLNTDAIVLVGSLEPPPPVDGDDNNGNQTIDLGFYPPMSLGNLVWKDYDNDGQRDTANPAEPGVGGVTVELWRDNGDGVFNPASDGAPAGTPLTTSTSTAPATLGQYQFTGLLPGNYFVRIPAAEFAVGGDLAGCLSSTVSDLTPNNDEDNDDNGPDNLTPATGGIVSNLVTLLGNSEPPPGVDGDDANGNQTVDFGFYTPMTLGNLVWKDYDNDGVRDLTPTPEPGVANVVVELYRDNGNNSFQPNADTLVTTTTTGANGDYSFSNLPPGVYFVRLAASNFASGGVLAGCLSSTGADNGDVDNNDNGVDGSNPPLDGIVSTPVTLINTTEPNTPVDGDDTNGNQTIDFGLYAPLTLGNLVWKDYDNDGQRDTANPAEPGVAGVTVQLYRETNSTPGLQLGGGGDTLAGTAQTDTLGLYSFNGLVPGDYYVRIPETEFATGGDLAGCLSSEPTEATPNSDGDNNDNGVNNPTPQTSGIASGVVTLTGNSEPTNDGDGPNGNQTVDFGFIPQMTLGNLLWKDFDNDGVRDTVNPVEPGVGNVTLELYRETNGTAGLQLGGGGDQLVGTTTTSNTPATLGQYSFTGLAPATYYVRIPAAEFATGGDLAGCLSSEPTELDPNADGDNNDDGVNNPNPGVNGINSGPVVLIGNSEPANEGDGVNGNQTVDFGFIPQMTLGNLVWKDLDNDGQRDLTPTPEAGVGNVTVELYREANGTGGLQIGSDTLIGTTTTSAVPATLGQYSFGNLPPAVYYVRIPAAEFATGGDLAGCLSSTPTDLDPNNDQDNDDNGIDSATPPASGIATGPIVLIGSSEPDTAVDGDNNNGNQTIDLGFYPPMSLGNLVWKDLDNDGQRDLTPTPEPGVGNVTVELYRDNGNGQLDLPGDTLTAVTTTSNTPATLGAYSFNNLSPGNYFARIPAAEFQPGGSLVGCQSSTPTVTDPNNNVDNDDNGIDSANPASNGVTTGLIVLVGTTEPDTAVDGDDTNGNQTVDFGFYAPLSLGNLVWKDYDNDGQRDLTPTPEPGVANVTVELFRDNGNSTFEPGTDQLVTSVLTATNGEYRFNNLQPGNYFVRVAPGEFTSGGDLFGCASSTPTVSNPNNDVDNDDNGIDNANQPVNGVVSGLIALQAGTEPDTAVDGDGTSGNQTIDFGFFTPMTLGNLVWKDLNDNGKRDTSPALEPAVANVTVELFRDNGNNTFDPPNDPLVDSKTTNSNGNYQFTNLPPGNYFVRLPASNFTSGGALFGCSSSSVTASDPNTDVDNDDNGLNTSNPPAAGVASGLVILVGNSEPDTQVDGDGLFGNQTVDFGFVTGSLQLGNLVWKDTNGNGLREATELPVANVLLELFRDSNGNQSLQPGTDTQVATTTTDANGKYLFANLTPGDYFVRVASSNFAGNGPLAGCVSTLGSQTANNDRDNDDNGSDSLNPAANPPASSVITLTQNGEPDTAVDGDDRNGNQTIDFGFYNPLTVSITDPATCVGPGSVLQITAEMINLGAATQPNNPGPEFVATLPPTLAAVTGSCSVQGGNGTCTIVNASRVEWNGSYAPGERVVISYSVQLVNNIQAGEQFCLTSTAYFDADLNGSNEAAMPVTICDKVTCQPVGPGIPTDNGCSVLIYPVYTSSPTNPNSSNTRINLTNTNPNKGTPVHLFFVDGASCSVTDAYVCLTANQTTTFLVSDLDPGTTGYVVAVAVDDNGCPASFNWLLGDEYVKFESGHFGNLTADCATRLPGAPQSCQVGANSTELRFDGASYSLLPRVVAVSNIPDRASGNDTLLTLHRLSGNLATGMDKLNSLFGILYDDAENGYSFNFNPNSCQFRSSLSNNFPRTAPRFEQVIPGGRSGWLKLYSQSDMPLGGAAFNRNANSNANSNAFNGAHNLHTLKQTNAGVMTMPVFPPSC